MELRDYLVIRRAYNLVRHKMDARRRLTFVEFAILCRISTNGQSMNTSDIACYQGALRPTMTHRTKHLCDLGLMSRSKGSSDRRNVLCDITDEGSSYVDDVCDELCEILQAGQVLSRTTPQRMCRYVDAMGALSLMSADLVLLAILQLSEACTVGELVELLGMLQPTVSMAVSALERRGLVLRGAPATGAGRSMPLSLSEEGRVRAEELREGVMALVVHRG